MSLRTKIVSGEIQDPGGQVPALANCWLGERQRNGGLLFDGHEVWVLHDDYVSEMCRPHRAYRQLRRKSALNALLRVDFICCVLYGNEKRVYVTL